MYDDNDPRHGSVVPGNLPNPQEAYKGYRPLFLTQKPHQHESMAVDVDPFVKVLELRNEDVELPQGDDSLHWCKMFKLQDIYQRNHVVKVSNGWFRLCQYPLTHCCYCYSFHFYLLLLLLLWDSIFILAEWSYSAPLHFTQPSNQSTIQLYEYICCFCGCWINEIPKGWKIM